MNMELFEAITKRHSVRDFKPEPVPVEVVERLTEAASAAPSSWNEQPWTFYCCQGETRARLGKLVAQTTVHLSEYMDALGPDNYDAAVEWFSSLGQAPMIVAISCPNPDSDFTAMNRYISIGAALENFLLAATEEGLGACTITFSYWVRDEMAALLGIPDEESIVVVIALGYPGSVPPIAPGRRNNVTVLRD